MERIDEHPILGRKTRREPAAFTFNGRPMTGFRGEAIAAALLAAGVRTLRRHEESGRPRGLYCAIGHCMECRLFVAGKGIVRACLTPLEDGMTVLEGQRLPNEITGRALS
ncbi:(2Fe-2S)-binding protein [Paenibacillaceae bacterium WGS1546]|uniref:(2Fe-2S)-binding protein n=1 Tax=Cohnella sp. WGS1546 TaxID=3366810 RepID=UPI00372D2FBE